MLTPTPAIMALMKEGNSMDQVLRLSLLVQHWNHFDGGLGVTRPRRSGLD